MGLFRDIIRILSPGERRGGQRVYVDERGAEYVLDENGNRMPPMQSKRSSADGEFTTYDSNQGHCGLCGRLTCRGGCFK